MLQPHRYEMLKSTRGKMGEHPACSFLLSLPAPGLHSLSVRFFDVLAQGIKIVRSREGATRLIESHLHLRKIKYHLIDVQQRIIQNNAISQRPTKTVHYFCGTVHHVLSMTANQ